MDAENERLICPSCGTPLFDPTIAGVHERWLDDLDTVVAAHRGELGVQACGNSACAKRIQVSRVVALTSREQGLRLLVPTSEEARHLAEALHAQDTTASLGVTPSEVSHWLSRWRSIYLQQFNRHQMSQAHGQQSAAEGAASWTPEFFSALYAMTIAPPRGSQIGIGTADATGAPSMDEAEALEALATQIDHLVWSSWFSAASDDGIPLQIALEQHVKLAAVRPAAIDGALDVLARIVRNDELPLEARYTAAAIAAFVCWQTGRPVEIDQEWSALWLNRQRWLVTTDATADPRHVPAELVAATTTPESFLTVLTLFARRDLAQLVDFEPALESVGRLYLLRHITEQVMDAVGRPGTTEEALHVLATLAPDSDFEVRFTLARALLDRADTADRAETGWAIADALLEHAGQDERAERQLRVEAWIGQVFKDHGIPHAFLARVGDRPRPWEADVDLEHRFAIAAERSNALRLTSRFVHASEALESQRESIEASPDSALKRDQMFLLHRNLAIIARDADDHEHALAELTALLPDALEHQLPELYASLAMSHAALGQVDRARDASEAALRWSTDRAQRAGALALAAQCRSLAGDDDGARDALREIDLAHLPNVSTVVRMCAVLVNLERSHDYRREDWEDVAWQLLDGLIDNDDVPLGAYMRQLALILRGTHRESRGIEGADDGWGELYRLAGDGGSFLAEAVVGLAITACRDDDDALLRSLLDQLPAALATRFGATVDVTLIAATTSVLEHLLSRLVATALDRGVTAEFARVLAELSRDLIGRSVSEHARGSLLPWDDVLEDIDEPCTVLEWLESEGQVMCLATTLGTDGGPHTIAVPMPSMIEDLGPALLPRLRYWKATMAGEPFDVAGWDDARAWAAALVEALSVERLVVVEHERFAAVPWQVLFGPHCLVTSVPSTSVVIAGGVAHSVRRVGAAAVSRFKDADAIVHELENAASAIVAAGGPDTAATLLRDTDADQETCLSLLAATDLMAFLCHGVLDSDSQSMAWLVAADGRNPPAGRFGALSAARRHRIEAADCDRLPRTAGIVLSAACSSGVARYVGVGEQIGLFGALRRRGTTSLIAPRWDVPAREVVPILVEIAERIVAGEDPLVATHVACRKAAEHLPQWIAWALFHQGMTKENA